MENLNQSEQPENPPSAPHGLRYQPDHPPDFVPPPRVKVTGRRPDGRGPVLSDAAASDDSDLRAIVHAGTPLTATALAIMGLLAGHARGVQAVAQCGTNATHLVGGELLALAATTEHDAEVCLAVTHNTPDTGTDGRVITALSGMGAEVLHVVTRLLQDRDEVLLQVVPCVICSDCYARHGCQRSGRTLMTA